MRLSLLVLPLLLAACGGVPPVPVRADAPAADRAAAERDCRFAAALPAAAAVTEAQARLIADCMARKGF